MSEEDTPKEGKTPAIPSVAAAAEGEAKPLKHDPMLDDDVPMTFPQKLMQVVSNEEHSDVISWLPHGKGFVIYKKKKFAAEILPRYFKQSKYTSFTRKLNRWGFTRVTRGPETGSYYHKFFQRGDTRLCLQMSCQLASSNKAPAVAAYIPFPGGKGGVYPAELQNQQLIRQQLQQLQLHQYHLQQMQLQQQQMQAAEVFRQQQREKKEGGCDKDEEAKGHDEAKGDEKPEEGVAPATPVAATNPYLQSLQQAGAAAPLGILPAFHPSAFSGQFFPVPFPGHPQQPVADSSSPAPAADGSGAPVPAEAAAAAEEPAVST